MGIFDTILNEEDEMTRPLDQEVTLDGPSSLLNNYNFDSAGVLSVNQDRLRELEDVEQQTFRQSMEANVTNINSHNDAANRGINTTITAQNAAMDRQREEQKVLALQQAELEQAELKAMEAMAPSDEFTAEDEVMLRDVVPNVAELTSGEVYKYMRGRPKGERQALQKVLGFTGKGANGAWGPKSQKEYDRYTSPELQDLRQYFLINFDNNIEDIRVKESGTTEFKEGELHVGQEGSVKNTTRYGVVEPNFPRKKGETDLAHATRYYNKRVLPELEGVKGISTVTDQAVISALGAYAWNKGSISSKLDLADETASMNAMLDITTTDGQHSNGVINRSISDYTEIAEVLDWAKVGSVTTSKKDADNKYTITYLDEEGNILYEDKTPATTKARSKIRPGKNYPVNGTTININGGTDY